MPVQNIDRLKAKLASLPVGMKSAIIKANVQNATQMVVLAQRLVPKGETGLLEASIRKVSGDTPTAVKVVAGGVLTTKDYKGRARYEKAVKIGAGNNRGIAKAAGGAGVGYDYALAIEFGKKARGKKKPVRARPFFWPSYRALKRTMKARLSRAANAAIKQFAASSAPAAIATSAEPTSKAA